MGRMMEQPFVLTQCRHKPGLIRRIAHSDNLPSTDQPAVHFGIVHLVTEFGVMRWRFAPTDNLRVRLNETHDFVGGRYAFAIQHTPFRLCHDLLDQRDQFRELLSQALREWRRRLAQRFGHRTTLGQGGAGNRQEFGIRLIYGFFLTSPRFEVRRRA